MIGKSRKEYVFIRISIALLRLIAPASIAYLGASLYYHKFLFSPWFGIYPTAEASFYLLVYLPRHAFLQKAAKHPPPLDSAGRRALFQKCLGYITGDSYPYGWFFSPYIKKENMVDWLFWALFSTDRKDAAPEWHEEACSYVTTMEAHLGKKLDSGHNGDVTSMRLTLDPVVMLHRPLLWYMIVAGVDAYTSLVLLHYGFKHYTIRRWFQVFPPRPLTLLSRSSVSPQISYWYRPHRSESKLPILFIHGIGIGLYPYLAFLREVSKADEDVGILAIELLPISMRITHPILSRTANCLAISEILASQNIDRFVLAAHSYGTVVAAHLLHSEDLGPRIASLLLIDPIPFLLHLPNVAHNFVYRRPRTANEWQLWYFASRDADVSRSLSRHFFWAENVMWKEELEGERPIAISLSGDDQVVDGEGVRKYLTGEEEMTERWEKDGVEVLFYPGLDHATVFDTQERRLRLVRVLHQFVSRPEGVMV